MSTNSESPIIYNENSSNQKFDKKDLKDYLIDYREGLWLSIRQKENGVWQFIAFFAGAIVLMAGFFDKTNLPTTYITIAAISLIVILVSFWGIMIILDANFWENRNLWIISNIEWRFLGKNELGKILPLSYANPEFRYTTMYTAHMYLLLIIVNIIISGNLVFIKNISNISDQEKLLVGLLGVFVSGLILYITNKDSILVKQYHRVRALMIGDRENFVNHSSFHESKNLITSPLLYWSYTLTMINSYFILFLLPGIGIIVTPFIYLFATVMAIVIMILILLLREKTGKDLIKKGEGLIKNGTSETDVLNNKDIKTLINLSSTSFNILRIINWATIIICGLITIYLYFKI